MTKEETKSYLIEKGASRVLIEMPAVMERIYAYFEVDNGKYGGYMGTIAPMKGISIDDLNSFLEIDNAGNITIKNGEGTRRFIKRIDGTATYINNDRFMSIDNTGEYQIDKYGMDRMYKDNKGNIVLRSNLGTIIGQYQEFSDDGSPIINAGYYLKRRKTIDSQRDENWERNKVELESNYPNVKNWFDSRDEKRKKTKDNYKPVKKTANGERNNDNRDEVNLSNFGKPKDTEEINALKESNRRRDIVISDLRKIIKYRDSSIKDLEDKIKEKEERIDDLQNRNSNLQERISRLQQMLNTALEKLQHIKTSMFGRFFFTKDERRTKKLPEGKDRS